MFEDITKEKKEIIKSTLEYDVTTKLNADAIAQKVITESKYFTEVELSFNFNKLKNDTIQLIFTKGDETKEFILKDNDTLNLTHTFNVN